MIKLHRNLCTAVIRALDRIFNEAEYADKVIQSVLKSDKRWGSRDRGFIAETTYEMVRYKRLYAEIAQVKAPYSSSDLWRMFAVWCVLRGIRLPEWEEFKDTPTRKIKGRFHEFSNEFVLKESIPDWLHELGTNELGKELWEQEIKALNLQAQVILRTNTLKISREELQHRLREEGITTKALQHPPEALVLDERSNVFKSSSFKSGFFEVQDTSSQMVAHTLDVEAGMKVVDACAGAGGKTLHLAALMKNKGQIIAMDIEGWKLDRLKLRARRNGVHNIDLRPITGTKVIKRLHSKCDRVLIDAPCSGLGVLKRNPDAKWKLDLDFLDRVRETQQQILQSYSAMLKPGGKMLYVTCSILPSENRHQIDRFLESENGKAFSLIKEHVIFAHQTGFDGFYLALMQKHQTP